MEDMQTVAAADMDPFQQHSNVSLSEVRCPPSRRDSARTKEAGRRRERSQRRRSCGRRTVAATHVVAMEPCRRSSTDPRTCTCAPPCAGHVYDACGAWQGVSYIDSGGR